MLTYTFENRGDMPYYEYLYIRIKNDILNGTLSAGEKLPSKRAFAAQLSVSVMTVENAYAQLIVEGYIYAVERKGYFVSDTSFLEKNEESNTPGNAYGGNDIEENASGEITYDGNNLEENTSRRNTFGENAFEGNALGMETGDKDVSENIIIDFTSNTIQPENFPFSVWAKLMRRVLTESREELLLKPPAQGMPELRTAIADHLRRFRGMRVKPEQVVIGAGTEYLYGLLIQLLGRDKIYGVENPGYRKICQIYRSNGVAYRTVALDESGIDMEALRGSNADIIHISPSHHFPTGIVTPVSRRGELLAWACERENRYIIEDDYDCEFRFTGRPIPTMAGIDRHDRVIYMNTFSKSLTPSIRISYMVLPETLAARFRKELGFYSCTVSNFEQMTLAAFLSEGYFEKHINRLRNYYRSKRNYLMDALLKSFPAGKAWIDREDAGLHFLLHLKTDLPDAELKAKAWRKGIRVSCLSDYYEDEEKSSQISRELNLPGQTMLYSEGDELRTRPPELRKPDRFTGRKAQDNRSRIERGTLIINYSGISTEDILTAAAKLRETIQ